MSLSGGYTKGEMDIFTREAALSKVLCLPSEKEPTLKGKKFALRFFLRRGLVCRRANRKSSFLPHQNGKQSTRYPFPLKIVSNCHGISHNLSGFSCTASL